MAPPTPPFPYALDLIPGFLPHASYRGLLLCGGWGGSHRNPELKTQHAHSRGQAKAFIG